MNKSLADILRDYRLHTGLTQKALAEKLAVDVHTLPNGKRENPYRVPSI